VLQPNTATQRRGYNVQKKSSSPLGEEDFFELCHPAYGLGDELVVVVVVVLFPGVEPVFIVVFDSVLVELDGDSFMTVVSFSVLFSVGGLVTVVSFCSQAARQAKLARTQMYLIMIMLFRISPTDCVSTEWPLANWWWCPWPDSKSWS
jgi:hypothetical protein